MSNLHFPDPGDFSTPMSNLHFPDPGFLIAPIFEPLTDHTFNLGPQAHDIGICSNDQPIETNSLQGSNSSGSHTEATKDGEHPHENSPIYLRTARPDSLPSPQRPSLDHTTKTDSQPSPPRGPLPSSPSSTLQVTQHECQSPSLRRVGVVWVVVRKRVR